MKSSLLARLFIASLALAQPLNAFETAWLNFNNYIGGAVRAPVTRTDGTGAGKGVTAQLVRVLPNGSITPLLPVTNFRLAPVDATGYVNAIAVAVPRGEPFEALTLRMRAWEGQTFESATSRGESKDFFITLGGNPSVQGPIYLVGLDGFKLEPYRILVTLSSPRINENGFMFDLRALPGTRIRIESSTSLIDWQAVSTLTVTDGLTQISNAATSDYRYYRAVVE